MKNVQVTDVLGIEEGGEGARLKRHKKDMGFVGGSENILTNCSLYVEIGIKEINY